MRVGKPGDGARLKPLWLPWLGNHFDEAMDSLDPAPAPGALVRGLRWCWGRVADLARGAGVGVRLKAAHRDLPAKGYIPAGYVYDDGCEDHRRPAMHLPTVVR